MRTKLENMTDQVFKSNEQHLGYLFGIISNLFFQVDDLNTKNTRLKHDALSASMELGKYKRDSAPDKVDVLTDEHKDYEWVDSEGDFHRFLFGQWRVRIHTSPTYHVFDGSHDEYGPYTRVKK